MAKRKLRKLKLLVLVVLMLGITGAVMAANETTVAEILGVIQDEILHREQLELPGADNDEQDELSPEDEVESETMEKADEGNYGDEEIPEDAEYIEATEDELALVEIDYGITEPTKENVVVMMASAAENVEIIDDEHEFTENDESFEFRFRYKVETEDGGNEWVYRKVTVRVGWIDREKPEGEIAYVCLAGEEEQECETDEDGVKIPTNKEVKAKLSISSDDVEGESLREFTFSRNGKYTFRVQDRAGNESEFEAEVDWIDTAAPKIEVTYTPAKGEEEIEGPVTARITKVSYQGEDEDETEDSEADEETGFVPIDTAKYDENGLEYDEDFVMITEGDEEPRCMTADDGAVECVFTENDEFDFNYRDRAGNRGVVAVKVDWIVEQGQTVEPVNPGPDDPNNPDKPDEPGDDEPIVTPSTSDDAEGMNGDEGAGDFQWDWGSDLIVGGPTNNGNVVADNNVNNNNNANNSGNGGGNTAGSGSSSNVGQSTSQGQSVSQGQSTGGSVVEWNGGNNTSGAEVEVTSGEVKVKSTQLTLTSALRVRFGANSELYEVKFVGEDGESKDVGSEKVTLTIPSGKKLEGIYLVKDDNATRKVSYEKVDTTHIELKSPVAGKYLFDYEDDSKDDTPVTDTGEEGESIALGRWYEGPIVWWIGGGILAVIVVGAVVSGIKERRR